MNTVKLYKKHLKKALLAAAKYSKLCDKLMPYEKDFKEWFAAQYKQYNYNHYITEIKVVNVSWFYITFGLKFTDTNLNGTVKLPIDKLMSLDVTYDDFVVKPYKSKKFKNNQLGGD